MRKMKLLAAVAASAVAFASAPAFAEGTASNTTVSNTATLSYQTGGVTQGNVTSNAADFLVDRKVNLNVVTTIATATPVGGATNAVTAFTVTNTSNAALDFSLTAINQVGGTAANGGTDNYDPTNFRYAVDTNGDGSYTPGTDLIVTKLSNVAADASRLVFVLADIPAGRVNGDVGAIFLVAQAQELGTTTNVVQTTTADNPAAVDTVFADITPGFTGSGDLARDGKASSRSQYNIVSAALTLTKIATVISDPFNATTNPKAIPGAVIEYCLIAANTGAADASNVTITDVISGKPITYVAGQGFQGGLTTGTGAATTCDQTAANGGTTANVTYTAGTGTFVATIATVPAGASRTARFRVTVN